MHLNASLERDIGGADQSFGPRSGEKTIEAVILLREPSLKLAKLMDSVIALFSSGCVVGILFLWVSAGTDKTLDFF